MSYLQANGIAVASGSLAIPTTGRPVAELRLASIGSSAPPKGEAVELRFEDGTTFQTTVLRSGSDGEFAHVFLVGGKGKLAQTVKAKDYDNLPSTNIVRDILSEVGESAGELALPDFPRWTRKAGTAMSALEAILNRSPEHNWRIHRDGLLWMGIDDYPDFDSDVVAVEADPLRGWYSLMPLPNIKPAVTLKGVFAGEKTTLGRVQRIQHCIGPKLRTEVWVG
jgi:hypothetical protein